MSILRIVPLPLVLFLTVTSAIGEETVGSGVPEQVVTEPAVAETNVSEQAVGEATVTEKIVVEKAASEKPVTERTATGKPVSASPATEPTATKKEVADQVLTKPVANLHLSFVEDSPESTSKETTPKPNDQRVFGNQPVSLQQLKSVPATQNARIPVTASNRVSLRQPPRFQQLRDRALSRINQVQQASAEIGEKAPTLTIEKPASDLQPVQSETVNEQPTETVTVGRVSSLDLRKKQFLLEFTLNSPTEGTQYSIYRKVAGSDDELKKIGDITLIATSEKIAAAKPIQNDLLFRVRRGDVVVLEK